MYKNDSNFGTISVRERFKKHGVRSLTDIELLQTFITSGVFDNDNNDVARNVNSVICKIGADDLTIDDLKSIDGVDEAKAALIFTALEFWRRKFQTQIRPVIDSPEQAASVFEDIKDKRKEHVCLITLDGARRLIKKHEISVGTLTSSLVHPREIFYPAIEDRAASIIIAHNHPSGMMTVSDQDRAVTKRIKDVGELLGIPLDDHLIITANGYVSAQ